MLIYKTKCSQLKALADTAVAVLSIGKDRFTPVI